MTREKKIGKIGNLLFLPGGGAWAVRVLLVSHVLMPEADAICICTSISGVRTKNHYNRYHCLVNDLIN
jgi:hypothetical protein